MPISIYLLDDFTAGHVIRMNSHIYNIGTEVAFQAYKKILFRLVENVNPDISDGATDRVVRNDLKKEALSAYREDMKNNMPLRNVAVKAGWVILQPIETDYLSQPQIDGIMEGKNRLYMYVWFTWKGAPDNVDVCQWLIPRNLNRDLPLMWMPCKG